MCSAKIDVYIDEKLYKISSTSLKYTVGKMDTRECKMYLALTENKFMKIVKFKDFLIC